MPAPIIPSVINGKVFDTGRVIIVGATVTLTHSTGSVSAVTNSSGEYALNLGDLSSWSVGDSAVLSCTVEKKGTSSTDLTLSEGGVEEDIVLEETSSIVYPINDRDMYPLVNAILRSFDGNLIASDNPLPVKTINSGDVDLTNNPSTSWVITRSDSQPDSESVVIKGVTYKRTFTYNSGGNMTARSSWVRQ